MALINSHHFKGPLNCKQVYRLAGLPDDTNHFGGAFNVLSLNSAHPLLDETSGVYLIWYEKTGECIYVGEVSKQPAKRRLLQHWKKAGNPHLRDWIVSGYPLNFCFAPCRKGKEKFYERKIMDLLDPEANLRR